MAVMVGESPLAGLRVGDGAASALRVGDELAWSATPPDPFAGGAYAVLLDSAQGGYAANTLLFVRSETYGSGSAITDVGGTTWTGTVYEVDESQDASRSTNESVPWEGDQSSVAAIAFRHRVRPRTCARWFMNNKRITEVDLSMLDCSRFYNGYSYDNNYGLQCMFYGCTALASVAGAPTFLDPPANHSYIPQFCTFCGCSSLAELDMSGWPRLASLTLLCPDCTSLVSVRFSEAESSLFEPGYRYYPFEGCDSLRTVVIPYQGVAAAFNSYAFAVKTSTYNQTTKRYETTYHEDVRFFVPDEYVDAYKADSRWTMLADCTYPMSDLPAWEASLA